MRPNIDEYMMTIAITVRSRANCKGNKVGAVISKEGHIISTGYNGTPHNIKNCDEGGCNRCSNRKKFPSGTSYDLCICVHAEQNAVLSAARFGISTEDAILYTTIMPCFGCAKEMLQAGIIEVKFLNRWVPPDQELNDEHNKLLSYFPKGVNLLKI
ncbi:MAG: CMP deaminase [Chloroflexi bacterium]|nr:CMP deaminase [Chloroflexota bacterium]|tara:strand:- start:8 stop:475 length:468 start_codon:yes stop_codon:yes gene_type:complete